MQEKTIQYELQIEIEEGKRNGIFYEELCAFLTGTLREEREVNPYMPPTFLLQIGRKEAKRYRKEEKYPFPVRFKEIEGTNITTPNDSYENKLCIYLKRPLNEEEIQLIFRRLKVFIRETGIDILSIKEIQKETTVVETSHRILL